jgi:iron complex transport system ATP-binding protein
MSLHEIDLAQKISDKIMCVSGDVISHFGSPDEIFREEIINELYRINNGAYNIIFGSVELPPPAGEPKVFVISGCGSGIPVFRRLQKRNIPFCSGILYKNDIDYQVAVKLAAEVIAEEPFMPISDEAYGRALDAMKRCGRVVCAGVPIGETNRRVSQLIAEAERLGLIADPDEY